MQWSCMFAQLMKHEYLSRSCEYILHAVLPELAYSMCMHNLQCSVVILMVSCKASCDVRAKKALIYRKFQLFRMT